MAAGAWDSYVTSNLTKYRHKEKTQTDVLLVFKSFRDLRPKMDTYTFNDGSRRELLCIEGTIPVFYKGNTYNIPVAIWIMDTHPVNPPLCFVKPTTDMLIKPSKYVDASGRVYLPYLADWKYPSSDLIGLIQVMSAVFGENPPLFAKGSPPPPPMSRNFNMPMPKPSNIAPGMPLSSILASPVYPGFPLTQQDNRLKENALLQREVTDLRSRLSAMELKLEEQNQPGGGKVGAVAASRCPPLPPRSSGNGADRAISGTDEDVCMVCHNPNEVEFQCGHASCIRCGDILDNCPRCNTQITQITVTTKPLNAAAVSKTPDERNPLRKTEENHDQIYDALSTEDKDFVMKIVALGFPKSRTARAVGRYGRNVGVVVDFLSAVDAICSEGFTEDRVEESLQLNKNDQKSAHNFLKLWDQFEKLGFNGDDIKRELIVHNNDALKVLDALTTD